MRAWYRGRQAVRIIGDFKITQIPPGEAPLEIRQAWVGVCVPVIKRTERPIKLPVIGVISGERFGYTQGYQVPRDLAVANLEKHAPKAAEWWRKKRYTADSSETTYLVFPEDCGVMIPADEK